MASKGDPRAADWPHVQYDAPAPRQLVEVEGRTRRCRPRVASTVVVSQLFLALARTIQLPEAQRLIAAEPGRSRLVPL